MSSIRSSAEGAGKPARLVLCRPERLNEFTLEGVEEALWALAELQAASPRMVVVTGEGRSFCAGGDLRWAAGTPDAAETLGRLAGRFHEFLKRIQGFPAPVLTLVNGVAAGGGYALALAGDLRWGTEEARFRLGYGRAGLSVDGGLSWRLPRIVGLAQAQRILFEDHEVRADEALRIGLLHRVVAPSAVERELAELLERLSSQGREATLRSRSLLAGSLAGTLGEAMEREERSMAERAASAEGREGLAAFVEKRPPRFA